MIGHDESINLNKINRNTKWSFIGKWLGTITVSIVLIVLALLWTSWYFIGGHLYMVSTPSMGMVAPVGSLVISPPNNNSELKVGQVAVFKVPDSNVIYIHRLYKKLPNGSFETKGDLEQVPDPWTITKQDIVGINPTIIPALGWVYKLAVWFFVGSAIILVGSMFIANHHYRHRFYIVCVIVLIIVPILIYKPLVRGYILNSTYANNTAKVALVNTGIFPAYYHTYGTSNVYAAPGQVIVISKNYSQTKSNFHRIPINITVAINWWIVLILSIVCAVPFFLFIGLHFYHKNIKSPLQNND